MAANTPSGGNMTSNPRDKRCEACGCPLSSYGSVNYSSEDRVQNLCMKCYNETVACTFGIEFEHHEFSPVTLNDADGEKHEFQFTVRLLSNIVVLEAFEIKNEEPDGYRFDVIGEPEDDMLELYTKLFTMMRRALGTKHIEFGKFGWQITNDNTVRGRIDYDPSRPGEHTPLLVIDGKEISWEEFGRMIMTYEGFNFRLVIFDKSEEC